MNYLEQEMRKIIGEDNIFTDIKFVGTSCYGVLGDEKRMKLDFVPFRYDYNHEKHYEGIRATILDDKLGTVDINILQFRSLFEDKLHDLGKCPYIKQIIKPNKSSLIWTFNEDGYCKNYQMTDEDYQILTDEVSKYADIFREFTTEISMAQEQGMTYGEMSL